VGLSRDPSGGEVCTEVAVRQDHSSHSESMGSSILDTDPGAEVGLKRDPSGGDVCTEVATIQQRDRDQRHKKEKEKKRVVVVDAQTKDSSPISMGVFLEEEGEPGSEPVKGKGDVEDESGSPLAHRDSSDPSVIPGSQPHHHGMSQGKLDSTNDDDALGQEYLPLNNNPVESQRQFPQPPSPPAAPPPQDAPFGSTAKSQPFGSQAEARELVQHFITVVQAVGAYSDAVGHPSWIYTARLMLGQNSLAVLTGAITYGIKIKYWRDALRQKGRDPFAFFEDRISAGGDLSLLAQSINNQPEKKQESSHGKKSNPAAAGRSAADISANKARDIAEQVKQAGRR
jgi:hypothetical protein